MLVYRKLDEGAWHIFRGPVAGDPVMDEADMILLSNAEDIGSPWTGGSANTADLDGDGL